MKRTFLLSALCGLFVLLFSSCSQTADKATSTDASAADMDKLKAEIQLLEDGYAAAEKAKNADGVVAYYSDDAISYNRNEPPSVGKAAIKERLEKSIAKDTSGNSNVYKVVDLYHDGDLLVEVGSWTRMSPSGAQVDNGHYMSVFQKKDGKYVCVRDMSVSSTPAKPSM